MKNATLVLLLISVFYSINSFGQVGDAYGRAAETARNGARLSKCPERVVYLNKLADYLQCWCNNGKAGATQRNCGPEPTPAPECKEDLMGNVQGNGGGNSTSMGAKSDPVRDMQQKQQQTQQEFSNAQSASDNAYQSAISSGKKTSGAMLDATLAGASQISDPTSSLVYTGVGLAIAWIARSGEKKQERLDAEAAVRREAEDIKREEDRKSMIIDAKGKFVDDALKINQYGFSDLISKDRYAALLLVPDNFNPDKQAIYFSIPVKVQQYSDSTYPLKDKIEKELLLCADKSFLQGKKIFTLYPIVNINKFEDDFTNKMGSSHLIYLDAAMIKFNKVPFYEISASNAAGTDFWGNPVTKKKVESSPKKKVAVQKEDFWDH